MKMTILLFAALLLCTSAAFAQGSIGGTITDAKGSGIANVTVVVVGAGGKAVATVDTDNEGAYTFDEIAAGKYKVAVYGAKGYTAAFRDDVVVSDDDTTTLNITLTAAKDVKPIVEKPLQPPVPAETGFWIKIVDGSAPGHNIIATVTYEQSGKAITRKEEGISTYVFSIPQDAANIQLNIEVAGVDEGTTWPILKKAMTRGDLNKCFKVSIDSPPGSWSNDCK